MAKRSRPRYNWPGLYSAYPTRGRCECGTDVLFGHHDSWEVRLDRPALGLFGECEALLNGCTTYLLVEPHIYRRSAAAIKREPNPKVGMVHRTHVCGMAA